MPSPRPSPVRTDGSNAFARHSIEIRATGLIDDIVERNPDYPDEIKTGLSQLAENIRSDAQLPRLDTTIPDMALWERMYAGHEEESWLDTEWFFAEMLAYRQVVEITGFRENRRDPFAPFKRDELRSEDLKEIVLRVMEPAGSEEERLLAHLKACLWGNRIDLSIAASKARGTAAEDHHLLTDHFEDAATTLLDTKPGEVHLIADNAGTELAMDLLLSRYLLSNLLAHRVVVHLKVYPVLVSDAIPADVDYLLSTIAGWNENGHSLADSIVDLRKNGKLVFTSDPFWNTSGGLFELPRALRDAFAGANLVISKGDANYRRASNDAIWPPGTKVSEALPEFPAPLLLLRTLKCDTLLEVGHETHVRLDAAEPDWKTTGKYGVAQFSQAAS